MCLSALMAETIEVAGPDADVDQSGMAFFLKS